MRVFVMALIVTGLTGCATAGARTAAADAPLACRSEQARQFDFLLGDWDIVQKIRQNDGGWKEFGARSSVHLAMDGCAVVEDWSGTAQFFWAGMQEPQSLQAISVRIWNPGSQRWIVHWMDSMNPQFGNFVGRFDDRYATFFRVQKTAMEDANAVITRMAYANLDQNPIQWELALSNDGGKSWQPLWVQTMTRKVAE